jgi:type I restriction enzyme M protein
MEIFAGKEDVPHIAVTIDNGKIAENDYNLSVSSYVEAKDTREKIDIAVLNKEISETVMKIDALRADIDEIVKEIEG